MTVGCRDADDLPKVPGSGEVHIDGVRCQLMHNGVKVLADADGGPGMTEIIRLLRGHHEPQEEKVFHAGTGAPFPPLAAGYRKGTLLVVCAVPGRRRLRGREGRGRGTGSGLALDRPSPGAGRRRCAGREVRHAGVRVTARIALGVQALQSPDHASRGIGWYVSEHARAFVGLPPELTESELADALWSVLRDPGRRRQLSRAARAHAGGNSFDAVAAALWCGLLQRPAVAAARSQ